MSENEKLAEHLLKLARVGFGYDINNTDRKALREAAAALTAAEARVKALGAKLAGIEECVDMLLADDWMKGTPRGEGYKQAARNIKYALEALSTGATPMTVDEKGLDVVAALAHLREKVRDLGDSVVKGGSYIGACGDVIDLIDAKIAYLSARSAEPVAWMWTHEDGTRSFVADEDTKRIWVDTMKRELVPVYLAHTTPEASDV